MTRKQLKAMNDIRSTFRGEFVREGTKPAYGGGVDKTILLKNVVEVKTGQVVTDHLWFNYTKGFESIGALTPGDVIEFDARVKTYTKGYQGRRDDVAWQKPIKTDYKLSHPTKIKFFRRHWEQGVNREK